MDKQTDEMLKVMLAHQIMDGKFKRIELTHDENGMGSCSVDGDTFGIIGAICVLLQELCTECGMPLDVMGKYIELGCQIVNETKQHMKQEEQGKEEEPPVDMTQFMSMFDKEEK